MFQGSVGVFLELLHVNVGNHEGGTYRNSNGVQNQSPSKIGAVIWNAPM